ncbi:MAG: hypothetical protein IPK60_19570 [Sandaracinaceae bacterium]|nr:hypothetical protein [Sandaracinaceae bacterium]
MKDHPGTYVAIVSLLRTDGSTLIRRRVRVILASDFVLVVHLTRDCVGVTCPQAGGSAALTECLDGQCVDARCNPPDPTFCPDITFCLTDTECPATASCATGRCVGGVCEEEMNTDGCTLNAYCDPDPVTGGCMPLAMTPDAGVLEDGVVLDMQIYDDASSDASLVPDAGLTVICGTVCTLTDVPCAVGYWLCAPGSAPVCTDPVPIARRCIVRHRPHLQPRPLHCMRGWRELRGGGAAKEHFIAQLLRCAKQARHSPWRALPALEQAHPSATRRAIVLHARTELRPASQDAHGVI